MTITLNSQPGKILSNRNSQPCAFILSIAFKCWSSTFQSRNLLDIYGELLFNNNSKLIVFNI